MASGDPCDKLSSLGVFQDLWEGSEMHTTQLRLSRLVYSEGFAFFQEESRGETEYHLKSRKVQNLPTGEIPSPGLWFSS